MASRLPTPLLGRAHDRPPGRPRGVQHGAAVGGALENYAGEHKEPLALGTLPAHTALVEAALWTHDIARHDRRRLSHAIWSVLSCRLS